MRHPITTIPQPARTRRHAALLGSAALAGLVVAGAVWLAGRPALTLLEERAERDLAASVAVLRLAEATGRLTAMAPLLADARTGVDRLSAHAGLRAQVRELTALMAEVGSAGLNRATAEGLRRPMTGMEAEVGDLAHIVEARIAADADLHNALSQVPARRAALRAALATLTDEALHAAGPHAAELLSLRLALAERAQRLADRLLSGDGSIEERQQAFRADARELEALLARLPIGPASAGRSEAARQLMALGLDTGNVFELRGEQARLAERIADLMRNGRARADEVSLLARRTVDGLREAGSADRAAATALLRAAPVLAGTLGGLAALGIAGRRRAETPAPPEPDTRDEAPPPGLRILLAEDERMTQTVAAALLRRAGHTVTAVDDGRAALEAVQAQPFDLVLLDLRMPAMDGVEALRRIRALPDRSKAGVRVVVLTASAVPEDAERCRAAGADAVLAKPLRLDALLPVLEGRSAPLAEDETAVFDAGALEQMLDALPAERVAALIGSALKALGAYRTALRAAWAEGDRATLSAMAHKMAGVAGVYGCPALRRAAQTLERGIETDEGDAASLMEALEAAYGPAIEALEREGEKLPSPSLSPAGGGNSQSGSIAGG
jgi:CheY-like chemotaxis protein